MYYDELEKGCQESNYIEADTASWYRYSKRDGCDYIVCDVLAKSEY